MISSLFSRSSKIINLEIKDHIIRFVELKNPETLSIQQSGEYLLPANIIKDGKIEDYETLQIILEQCVKEWKITNRPVRFLVPDQSVLLRRIAIDKDITDSEIEGHLYMQLGSSIHLPFEEPVFDVVVLDEEGEKKELLLFAAEEAVVQQYNELLEECKLKPIVADLSSLAIYRFYNKLYSNVPEEHVMILQVDLYGINVSVFSEDKPIFMRHIVIPIEQENWAISLAGQKDKKWEYQESRNLYIHLLEDVFKEIDRVMTFYKYNIHNNQHDVSKLVLTGDHPFLPEIIEQMQSRYPLPVLSMNTADIEETNTLDSSYDLVIGLALRGGK